MNTSVPFGIDGDTGIILIIADPISHVRTPQRMNGYLREIGVNAVVVPAHVTKEDLPAVLESCRRIRNLRGLFVTVPHKIDVVGLCDGLEESARLVGAVNVVRRTPSGELIGANYDGTGFVGSIRDLVGDLTGKAVFMMGAGGVARSIAFAFAKAGVRRLTIANRTQNKAVALANEVRDAFPDTQMDTGTTSPQGYDIALNASTLGLHEGDPVPFSIERLTSETLIADVIMQPLMTPLLLAAKTRGHPICTGDRMLEHQLTIFTSFLGLTPPDERGDPGKPRSRKNHE